ncbi:MAG: hypothetical protein FK733_13510 [Asgard group archaeon]|nr:hypothetical protein [Asgard group archaeon]
MSIIRNSSKIDTKLTTMITSSIVIICSIVVIILSYVIAYKHPVQNYNELIGSYFDSRMIHSTETFFNLLMALFIIPSMIGIILFLRTKINPKLKNWLLLPLVSSVLGAALVVALYCVKIMIIYKLVPDIINNPSDTSLVDQFLNLATLTDQLSALAFILLYTIGTGALGIFTLRISISGGNLSWLAIATGILALGKIGYFIDSVFGSALTLAASMGVIAYFVWLGGFVSILFQARKESKMDKMVEIDEFDENELES